MDWRNRASCINIPTNIFFPGTDKQTDKRYWDTHTMCRECPVNVDCLAEALNHNIEIGLYCMPERVRRRFKAKPPKNLYISMRETFTTLDII